MVGEREGARSAVSDTSGLLGWAGWVARGAWVGLTGCNQLVGQTDSKDWARYYNHPTVGCCQRLVVKNPPTRAGFSRLIAGKLGCGAPATKAAEGATEVWGFASGNGMTVASASYDRFGGTAVSSSRFCHVNIAFAGGQVSTINYTGPTGGLLTAGEQCAYAVNNCVRRQ
jgi:hypothetical protein